ncbi:MAG: CHAT domain-containing tetratricopeptide repeat protein [Thermodesulfobacteriota bacterium]|nr:CHAT domain-containing tetratricopeptide repeat protein [Thermodesulfobacteriota bacterium]
MSDDIQQQISKLNQQAVRLYHQGRYEEAIQSASQVRDLSLQYLGKDHLDFATSLNNLAEFYRSMGNYTQAEPLLKQAMEITRKALGEDHPDFATSLNNLALLYRSMGNYTQAEPLLKQALEIKRKALGEDHPDFATVLNNLAGLYESMGNYTQAEPLFKQALEIKRKAMGEDHPSFATSLNNLALLYIATNRETEGLQLMEQAASIDDLMIGQVFSIGSENQRTAYLKKVQMNIKGFISLISQHLSSSQTAINSAIELVLRRKAIGAEALAVQRDAVLGGRYPELKPELKDLINLRMQIAQKTLAGPGQEGLAEHQKTLSVWNKQKENSEAELVRQIPEMNLEQKLKQIDRQAIASTLPEGAALIEFVHFDVFDFKAVPAKGESSLKPARYLAFVILAGNPDNVQMIDLGKARFIDKSIARFRDSVTGGPEDIYDEPMTDQSTKPKGVFSRLSGYFKRPEQAETRLDLGVVPEESVQVPDNEAGVKLRETIFDKLKPALGRCKHLFISPDGELSRVPFEVLPNETGRFLIDDYHISYLGAGRDILRFGTKSTGQPAGSLIIADPDFDLGLKTSGRLAQKGRPCGRQSRDLDRSSLHFGRLPGTHKEGINVSNMLGVKPWLKENALEAWIKKYRSPRILHFATHGFFIEDQERDPNKEMRELVALGAPGFAEPGGMGRLSGLNLENPLLRSGLALAGANTWLKGQSPPSDAEDGLLTAEDVTGLDLLDTELVVLSACETGLGEVRTGEGVFGLRRSFVLAGADTLVMSLWKVPDQQTRELMEEFYSRILTGEPRAQALKNAQMSIRSKHPHPFYWGAFICQGDPGPLS